MIFTAGLFLAAAAVGASAQDLSSLSPSCQAAATGVLTGPAGTCLGVGGLLNIAMTPANESIVAPIDNWLTTTCAQPACTNATIDALISNVTTGCASDLSTAGVTNDSIAETKKYIENWYPVAREVVCLKDSNNSGAFCITSTLKAIESYINGSISANSISDAIYNFGASGVEVPKNLICTSCVQAAYALIRPHLDDANRGTWDTYLGGQCGASYTNGTTPAGIIQSANTAPAGSTTSASGAMSLKTGVFGSAVAVILGVAGAVTLAL
ncbi:hypothetical protein BDV93DRAFT_528783 [Ceratobasidium sp. AG-I]|nr:hypothetical protein BDV93DRAFT_528783 [Ceratobasidium sp. AG-I]